MIGDGSDEGRPGETLSLEDIPLHSTNLLSLLDRDGVIRYQSPAIARLCGFEQADLVGVSCIECFHPADRDRVYAAFERIVESEEYTVEAVEYRHLNADGSYTWVESVTSSTPTPDGYYVINTRDITARKRTRQELERANTRLNEFADVVSHDLRNPLGVAQGYLELNEDELPADDYTTIADALDRMEALIDGLLTNARVENRGAELRSVELRRVIESCWHNVVTPGATLHADVDLTIRADELQLTQLLENLFRNALDHAPDGVAVTVGALEDGFYVEDDGPGISEAERADVFDTGYSTSTHGTGLGLAIVERVVESHGWDIQVTESPTGGARFEVTGVAVAS
ncbi:PAS domain-containing sensor histidine kinase [Halobaculum limi]|uniref:PAS domain-containing sensor histidine kinase n=1 Tax=Halobaculum limi TaxID=3031916 RepID=UPI002406E759|nr:PAS domain-containing sensor histidine kinase [Halobaculum sp. YSMS11]